ncbi:MAG: UDP-3-O-(3-hydroxymyristoyl)glucosamine N-acyltransferase [Saprospiraceae bacterium]|nr:UDP-3-O-(3-hydroxymyristoyl)glucosamine N-acyltransferase [Saprospiraceae bacterium]
MRFPAPLSVAELAKRFNAILLGDAQRYAHGINEIHKVEPGDITFVDIEKYYKASLSSAATIILIDKEVPCPDGKTLLVVDSPFDVYDTLVREHRPFQPLTHLISATATIHPSSTIEPQVVVGHHVSIGKDCHIQGNCYIGNHTTIGDRVVIQAGTMIGTDAFYFKEREGRFDKWCSGGEVIIENDVFIGACCSINKGVSGATVIGAGSKLDSQVHIGHGAVLGKHCLLAGQVGVGGKAQIGNHVKVYGQAGIGNNITIGDRAIILAKAGVVRSLDGDKSYFGMPAEETHQKFKQIVAVRNLLKSKGD